MGQGGHVVLDPIGSKLHVFQAAALNPQPVFHFRFNQNARFPHPTRDAPRPHPLPRLRGRRGSPLPSEPSLPRPRHRGLQQDGSPGLPASATLPSPQHSLTLQGDRGEGKAETGSQMGGRGGWGSVRPGLGQPPPAMGQRGAEGPGRPAAPLPCPALPQAATAPGWLPARRAGTRRPLAVWPWRGPSLPPGKGKGDAGSLCLVLGAGAGGTSWLRQLQHSAMVQAERERAPSLSSAAKGQDKFKWITSSWTKCGCIPTIWDLIAISKFS